MCLIPTLETSMSPETTLSQSLQAHSCRYLAMHGFIKLRYLQDWTRQASEDAEGVISFTYRTRPEDPPDVLQIQRQMAIVAWQRGPNRHIQVPTQVSPSLSQLRKLTAGIAQQPSKFSHIHITPASIFFKHGILTSQGTPSNAF